MASLKITEERVEMMAASPTNREPIHLKKAHFLAPTATSANATAAIAPPPSAAAIAAPNSFRRTFLGWKTPTDNWKTWVDQMYDHHHATWRLAGILDAILASRCHVKRNQGLLFHFLENFWCPATNTFVFPWGEATITLEDVMVLGGYSVLGRPVFGPDPDGSTHEAVYKLNEARSVISNSTAKKPCHNGWITIFQESKSEIEHEAFLAYWLSRFVFPFKRDAIGKNVLPLAASLARGTRVALAPAVLAGIYHNLTTLQSALVNPSDGPFEVLVTAPLSLVQAWVWERFWSLSPRPKEIGPDEPRLARWHGIRTRYAPDYGRVLESPEEFEWRPYTRDPSNGVPRDIYREKAYVVIADPDFGSDLEGLVRCLRPSDLVGFEVDSIKSYHPHRVAMQFGLDQDVPGHAGRLSIMSAEAAWRRYSRRPSEDATMYIPSRFDKGGVTVEYSEWWRKMRSDGERSSLRRFLGRMFELHPPPPTLSAKFKTVTLHEEGHSPGVRIRGFMGVPISGHDRGGTPPPGFPLVRDSEPGKKRFTTYEEGSSSKRTFVGSSSRGKFDDHGGVSPPPGFSPTSSSEKQSSSS